MKDFWKTIRLAAYIFALPLVATAAVSAGQLFQQDDATTTLVVKPKVKTVNESELVGLNGTFRQHTIAADKDGNISGQAWVVDSNSKEGLADSKVFFVKDGEIAQQVYTDPDGTFTVSGLETGAYSFVISNFEGVASYGVNVVEKANSSSMDVVIVSTNATKAQEIVDANKAETQSTELNSEIVRGSNLAVLNNGELEGRLHSTFDNVDFTGATVQIFDTSRTVVGQATTDALGNFVVSDLETGYYEFVATGPQGHATFGFEAVEENAAYTSTALQIFDATLTSPVDSFAVGDCSTCSNDVIFSDPVVQSSPVEFAAGCSTCSGSFTSAAPVSSGCGCCSCGGGGGFGGRLFGSGGGRLRRILPFFGLLGLLAVGDDDDGTVDPGPATPSTTGS